MTKQEPAKLNDRQLLTELDQFGAGVEKAFQAHIKVTAVRRRKQFDIDPDYSRRRWIELLKEMDKRFYE
jgi:hypothetical protein